MQAKAVQTLTKAHERFLTTLGDLLEANAGVVGPGRPDVRLALERFKVSQELLVQQCDAMLVEVALNRGSTALGSGNRTPLSPDPGMVTSPSQLQGSGPLGAAPGQWSNATANAATNAAAPAAYPGIAALAATPGEGTPWAGGGVMTPDTFMDTT